MPNQIKNLNQNSGQIKNQKRSSKKEPFSLMTVKTILAILLFTGMGVIIIGGGYIIVKYTIISPDKTDLPITNPVIETQCEIDTDCKLAYTGSNICLPCDTSVEEYKCLPLEEAKKIEEERFKRMVDDNIFCERCLEKPQHICVCSNGKCEKVKEELVEDVSITTNRMEYETGETVKITIENNSDEEQKMINSPAYFIERFEKNSWIEIEQVVCPCGAYCDMLGWTFIKSKDKLEYEWNQQESWCSDGFTPSSKEISNQVQSGKYRIKSIKIGFPDPENYETIYSNEFTIKEKSALDSRCGEEVKDVGFSKFSVSDIGYEFSSDIEKCVKKIIRGHSIESPFETLEECQEVCEKKECAKEGELINFPAGTNKNLPDVCCEGSKGLFPYEIENGKCERLISVNGLFLTCMPCGNGICETINNFGEDKCNCPEDCG